MEATVKAKMLTAESKPYSFEGNEGVSNKVRISVEGEIFSCNSSKDQIAIFKQFEGSEGTAKLKFTSRKENLKLEITAFEPD